MCGGNVVRAKLDKHDVGLSPLVRGKHVYMA